MKTILKTIKFQPYPGPSVLLKLPPKSAAVKEEENVDFEAKLVSDFYNLVKF